MDREGQLVRTLVELADVFVEHFDVLGLLTERCVEIFGASAAGIILVSADGHLGLMTSSNEALRNLELFELQVQEGSMTATPPWKQSRHGKSQEGSPVQLWGACR
jgi:hypothetical protein